MAREEAARLHHEFVGTEHILLGIVREGEGVACAVLQNLDADLEDIRDEIEKTVKEGKAANRGDDLPYTSRAKKILELSMSEARELNHSYVGTEHLLLGVLREEKGIGAQVLMNSGSPWSESGPRRCTSSPQSRRRRIRPRNSRCESTMRLTDRSPTRSSPRFRKRWPQDVSVPVLGCPPCDAWPTSSTSRPGLWPGRIVSWNGA